MNKLLAQHESELAAFMAKYANEPLPAGPAPAAPAKAAPADGRRHRRGEDSKPGGHL